MKKTERKPGRPYLGDEGRIKGYHIRFTTEEYNWIKKLSKSLCKPIAELIRIAMHNTYDKEETEKHMILYLVIARGYIHPYGLREYCIGAFDTKEKADEVADEYYDMVQKDIYKSYCKMTGSTESEFNNFINEKVPNTPLLRSNLAYFRYYYKNKNQVIEVKELDLNKKYQMHKVDEEACCFIEFENDLLIAEYTNI